MRNLQRLFLRSIALLGAVLWMASAGLGCKASPKRIGFEEARRMFESRGVQPGQPLPQLSLVTLEGHPASLPAMHDGRPLVLVTASLTCNVARRRQPDLDDLARRYAAQAAVVVIYTIDAHPQTDLCPYTGEEWVPADNVRDEVLVRQPTDLSQRLSLARDYQQRFSEQATVLVDTMDNASWKALGSAPNLGLLVDAHGLVRLRQGWFDGAKMEEALITLCNGQSAD